MTRRSADATTASSGSRSSASRRTSKAASGTRSRSSSRSAKRSAPTAGSTVDEPTPAIAEATESAENAERVEGVEPPRRRTRAKRGQGEQLREQILDAAHELLVETGNADLVSTRAVARRVGCSSPALYLHFPDRAALMWAVCNRQFTRLGELIREAVADQEDPIGALQAAGRAYITFGVEHAQEYRVMMMGPETVVWDPAIGELPNEVGFDVLHELLSRAMAEGVIREDDPTSVAITVWAIVHGVVALRIAKPSFPWPPLDDDIDRVLALLADGLAPRDAPATPSAARPRPSRGGTASRAAKVTG